MKKFIFLLTAFLTTISFGGYAQRAPKFEGTKEEAIAIIRNSEFLNMLRYDNDEDPSANIDRFIVEVNRVFPLDQQRREQLKNKILEVPQKNTKIRRSGWLLFWPMGSYPRINSPVDEVLKDFFTASEYEMITEQLVSNMTTVRSAYYYLMELQKVQEGWVITVGLPDTPHSIEQIYRYFDI